MIAVYAIADRDDLELPAEERLERVTNGAIAGIFSRDGERPDQASAEALWRHERLVEALMEDRAVLPLRYGTVLADEWALEKTLTDRCEEFSRLLGVVRGRVELALRVLDDGAEPEAEGAPRSGRAYMQALARRQRRSEEAATLLEPLESLADAARRRESASDDLTRWAFLIERGRVDDFNARLDDLRGSHPELRMTCTGPWPPYSFVSEER